MIKAKISQYPSQNIGRAEQFINVAERERKAQEDDIKDQLEGDQGRKMIRMIFQDADGSDQQQSQKNQSLNLQTQQYKKVQRQPKQRMQQMPQQQRQIGVNFITLNLNIQTPPIQQVGQLLPPSYPSFKGDKFQGGESINPLQEILNMRKKKKITPFQQQQVADKLGGVAGKFIKTQLLALQYKTNGISVTETEGIDNAYLNEDHYFRSIPEEKNDYPYSNSQNGYNSGSSCSNYNSSNNRQKNVVKYGQAQTQEIIPNSEDNIYSHQNRESKSPSSRQGINQINDQISKIQCTHKHKPSKEGSFAVSLPPHGLYYQQNKGVNAWERAPKGDYDNHLIQPELFDKRRMRKLNFKTQGSLNGRERWVVLGESNIVQTVSCQFNQYESQSQRFIQQSKAKWRIVEQPFPFEIIGGRQQKGKMQVEMRKSQDNEDSRRGVSSSEKYEDNSINMKAKNQHGNKVNILDAKGRLSINNLSSGPGYNGIRNEPSSHQLIALKLGELEDAEQSELKNSKCMQRQSILPSIGSATLRGPLNADQQELYDQIEQFQNVGQSFQQGYKRDTKQSIKPDRSAVSPDQSSQLDQNTTFELEQGQMPTSQQQVDSKKLNRKVINANTIQKSDQAKKQENEKRLSAPNILKSKNSQSGNSSTSSNLMTQQQKDRVQKSEQEINLSQKIKMYLDFQRIINFSNNMTMQPPPPQGLKIYKAYITKGNNGVLIRAVVKSRWWWSLSETIDDLENIHFLWTQWRKPNFYKLIKSRAELAVQEAEESINQEPNSLQNIPESSNKKIQDEDLEQTPSNSSSKDIQSETEKEGQSEQTKTTSVGSPSGQGIESFSHSNQSIARNGYNEDPMKSMQDYVAKQQVKKGQAQTSPVQNNRKASITQMPSNPDPFSKISSLVNEKDLQIIKKFIKIQKQQKALPNNHVPPPVFNREEYEEGIEKVYEQMRRELGGDAKSTPTIFKIPGKQKIHNHMEFNFHLANKKALYYNMKLYYNLIGQNVFDNLPVTFHIQNGLNDPEFNNFVSFYNTFESENPKRKNVWIIKPGESSNRGNGIQVAGDVNSVRDIIKNRESHQNGFKKTYIIQQYIDRPFLYNKRKFDIRCFMLMTNYNNNMKAYWYQEGYIRTSTKEFTLKNLENRMIHLTNEAVQKRGDDFGKFENGNKLSYSEFQKYIDVNYPKENYNFMQTVYPTMKRQAYDSVCSVYTKIDKKMRNFSFELFGLDFMIDDQFRTWLIEINTNPSLTIAAPIMSRLLPGLVDNVLKIAIDPIFPPPSFPKSKKSLIPEQIYENNKFDLLFDSIVDGARINTLYQNISRKSKTKRKTIIHQYWIIILSVDEQLEEDCKNEEVYDDDDADRDEEEEDDENE